jgi:hypothetical protein
MLLAATIAENRAIIGFLFFFLLEGNKVKQLTRFLAISVASVLGVCSTAQAEITLVEKNGNTLSTYGFLKADAVYQDDEMNSKYAPRFAQTGGSEGTNLTAMHSRFGIKWGGPQMEHGFKAGGVFEFDLFDSSNNQMDLRTRLAALTLSNGKHNLLFGQHWDVFSPLNVTTLMTNGNMWQTGNLGFRRAQARYTYKGESFEFAGSINDPSTGGGTSDVDSPLLEGRVGFGIGNAKLGVSGTWGQDETTVPSVDADIYGVSADLVWKFNDQYQFKGEIATGENLGVFLSRAKVSAIEEDEQEAVSAWGQVVYTGDKWNWWAGGAIETVDDVDPGTIDDTYMYFGALQYKLKSVSGGNPILFAGELAFFNSETSGSGSEPDAFQFILCAQYNW